MREDSQPGTTTTKSYIKSLPTELYPKIATYCNRNDMLSFRTCNTTAKTNIEHYNDNDRNEFIHFTTQPLPIPHIPNNVLKINLIKPFQNPEHAQQVFGALPPHVKCFYINTLPKPEHRQLYKNAIPAGINHNIR